MHKAVSTIDTQIAPLKIVIVGHVDHGKSTVVGRIFHDTGTLADGRVEAIEEMCKKRGMPFEWAFVMDSLQSERDQGITIDVSQVFFNSSKRRYVLIDAPGHHEFIKNMVTGAASADAAVLVIDAEHGVREETRRHAYLLHLLGLRRVVVALSKMDLVDYSEAQYNEVKSECVNYLSSIGLDASAIEVVPVSGRDGDNIVNASTSMNWYTGPKLLDCLDQFSAPAPDTDLPLRLPVQDVYKFDKRRIVAGRIESGKLAIGDALTFSPSNKSAKIQSIELWNVDHIPTSADAGQSIGITLDQQIFVERGEVASHLTSPPCLTNMFRAKLFWLGRTPVTVGCRYKLKMNTASYVVEVEKIEKVINVEDLGEVTSNQVDRYAVGEVIFRSRGLMAVDAFTDNMNTGRFVLVDNDDIAGGGLIDTDGFEDQRQRVGSRSQNVETIEHGVKLEQRWRVNGHKSGIIWFTGLPGSGKSTLSFGLEKALFDNGYHTYVLDGENIRQHLSEDLSFSPEDRSENIRRVGQSARLFANAGVIAITSFISPYRTDRDRVRALAPNSFHEIYLNAPIEICEARDTSGAYEKARRGEIQDFTGITAPYEKPVAPELTIDTVNQSAEQSLEQLIDYVRKTFLR